MPGACLRQVVLEKEMVLLDGCLRVISPTLFGFQNNVSIVLYAPKKNKAVILLSVMYDDASIDKDTGKSILLDNNDGVNAVDTLGGTNIKAGQPEDDLC
ncbi:hypothetical protein NPIL_440001 [Nephila pilipes]|uniref:Uncharacterized protein n=1 Tax=Nephila pilipes TaxID=299642 RepID=A0A8X6PT35_NEPPI|nr:hypothetical protein NPIL_440001 [Nephila pilipes]